MKLFTTRYSYGMLHYHRRAIIFGIGAELLSTCEPTQSSEMEYWTTLHFKAHFLLWSLTLNHRISPVHTRYHEPA